MTGIALEIKVCHGCGALGTLYPPWVLLFHKRNTPTWKEVDKDYGQSPLAIFLTLCKDFVFLSSTLPCTCDTFVVYSSDSSPSVTSFISVVQKVLPKSGSDQNNLFYALE